ncbi:M48 family metalloprotease [bacterium]|nr:M48 family metalloprotease [bacterium]
MKKAKILLFLVITFLLITGCSVDPVTGKNSLNFYSETSEIKMGEDYHPTIIAQYGEYHNSRLKKYIQSIVSRLGAVSHRPNIDYRVTLLDTPLINAFAIPGGRVYVCRGLLIYANSEAELAAVMGHEIGHVTARHGIERMSQQSGIQWGLVLGTLLFKKKAEAVQFYDISSKLSVIATLSYSRENEMESDRLGIHYAHQSGFSPLGAEKVFNLFERMGSGKGSNPIYSMLSTHPVSATRAKQARIEVRKIKKRENIIEALDRNKYLDMINNLELEHNPATGTKIGDSYYNTTHRLKYYFSKDYTIHLEIPGYLFALQNKDKNKTIYFNVLDNENASLDLRARKMANDLKTSPKKTEIRFWNNSKGIADFYMLEIKKEKLIQYKQVTHYLVKYFDKLVEITMFENKKDPYFDNILLSSVLKNLKVISHAENNNIKQKTLQIYRIKKRDSWDSITAQFFHGSDAKQLAWMNGRELNEPLPSRIKLLLF